MLNVLHILEKQTQTLLQGSTEPNWKVLNIQLLFSYQWADEGAQTHTDCLRCHYQLWNFDFAVFEMRLSSI